MWLFVGVVAGSQCFAVVAWCCTGQCVVVCCLVDVDYGGLVFDWSLILFVCVCVCVSVWDVLRDVDVGVVVGREARVASVLLALCAIDL